MRHLHGLRIVRCCAFSLVELLVVIAIVSVLAAMLLPTVEGSLVQARLLACANQERQLYLGMMAYAESYGGGIARPDLGRVNGTWTGFNYSIVNDCPVGHPRIIQRHGAWLMGGGISTDLYFCPGLSYERITNGDLSLGARQRAWQTDDARRFFESGGMVGNASRGAMTPTSYVLNLPIFGSNVGTGQYPLDEMNNCTRVSRLKSYFPVLSDARIMYWDPRFVNHEGRGFNIMMADGSVRFLTLSDFCATSGRIYWSANTYYDPWKGYSTLPNTDSAPIDVSGFSYLPNNPFACGYAIFWQGALAATKYGK